MAPTEREQLIAKDDNGTGASSNMFTHQWVQLNLPFLNQTLNIRTIKSKVALMDSHVGEELWDAAKLFCAHLCRTALLDDDVLLCSTKEEGEEEVAGRILCNGKRLRGKRVLELGAGVGSLGVCVAALGADEVVCTDYDNDVLENLNFNVYHNVHVIQNSGEAECNLCREAKEVSVSKLDWRLFAAKDIQNASWLLEEESQMPSNSSKFCLDFKPDILIGSALIYSAQGALCCADTICFFLTEKKAKECWILQMPERPGFDRFLLRLEHHGLVYECDSVPEETFQIAERHMGRIHSRREDFQMYLIRLK